MISEGTKQLDLYDFFSVFIPGSALVLGVAPFLSEGFVNKFQVVLVVILLGGFISGRWVHAIALWIEGKTSAKSHREKFKQELRDPSSVNEQLVDSFYQNCQEQYEDALPDSRPGTESCEEECDDPDAVCDAVYCLVRSAIHMDSRGRSRTFQAILDFYRSMWLVAALLAVIYMTYGLNELMEFVSFDINYTPIIETLNIPPEAIILGGGAIVSGAYITFKQVRSKYRRYFVEYLFADFLSMSNDK